MDEKPFYLKKRLYINLIMSLGAFAIGKWPEAAAYINEVTIGVLFTVVNTILTATKKPTLE